MILSDRKVLLIASSIFTVLIAPRLVFAETIVTGDSHSSVSVKNSGGTTGRTDIVIECNGVKKEYHSDKAENVTLNCDDETSGTVKSEVNISDGSSITPNPTIQEGKKKINEEIEKKKNEIKGEVKSAKDKIEQEQKNILEQITQIVTDFFKNFHL